jgi:hypothetical protein
MAIDCFGVRWTGHRRDSLFIWISGKCAIDDERLLRSCAWSAHSRRQVGERRLQLSSDPTLDKAQRHSSRAAICVSRTSCGLSLRATSGHTGRSGQRSRLGRFSAAAAEDGQTTASPGVSDRVESVRLCDWSSSVAQPSSSVRRPVCLLVSQSIRRRRAGQVPGPFYGSAFRAAQLQQIVAITVPVPAWPGLPA